MLTGFYSKLVRLKRSIVQRHRLPVMRFLFQIGTIKTFADKQVVPNPLKFLFQIGTIKTIAAINTSVYF